eukprot:COSAG02_NODE_58042_length_278_cov_1.363128_1_plen_28_part_01
MVCYGEGLKQPTRADTTDREEFSPLNDI